MAAVAQPAVAAISAPMNQAVISAPAVRRAPRRGVRAQQRHGRRYSVLSRARTTSERGRVSAGTPPSFFGESESAFDQRFSRARSPRHGFWKKGLLPPVSICKNEGKNLSRNPV